MDPIDWKSELNRMLDTIEQQSSVSLEKINQSFDELGLPFNDDFRQHVVKMVQLRLESSFAKINLNQWGTRPATGGKSCCKSANDPSASDPMEISVQTPDKRIIPFKVGPSTTVGSIKTKIRGIEGFAPDQQLRLIYVDRQLQDGLTMSHYKIQNKSTLRMEIRRKVNECEWQALNE